VLAALSGLGVDNRLIEIERAGSAIMECSAAPFVEAIHRPASSRSGGRAVHPDLSRSAWSRATLWRASSERAGFRIELDINFDHR